MNTLTVDQARRYAWKLHEWRFDEVQIVERIPSGERFVRARNRAGQLRLVGNVEEFNELKRFEVER